MGRASTMKIYLMGRGHRLEQIRDALGLSRLVAQMVESTNFATYGLNLALPNADQ